MTPLKQALKVNTSATLILAGIDLVLFILALVFSGNMLLIFGWGIFMGAIFFNMHDRKRIRRSFCPSCEEQYDYENDVAWECSNVVTTASKQKADVEIECICHCCGQKTQFKKRFETAEVDAFGRVKEYNIYNIVRKYYKN